MEINFMCILWSNIFTLDTTCGESVSSIFKVLPR